MYVCVGIGVMIKDNGIVDVVDMKDVWDFTFYMKLHVMHVWLCMCVCPVVLAVLFGC